MKEEKVKIIDKLGFHYEVAFHYSPHFGFATAIYEGSIIGQVELGRILEPFSDDDREWEIYEETFAEWRDEIKVNLIPQCQNHFNELHDFDKQHRNVSN